MTNYQSWTCHRKCFCICGHFPKRHGLRLRAGFPFKNSCIIAVATSPIASAFLLPVIFAPLIYFALFSRPWFSQPQPLSCLPTGGKSMCVATGRGKWVGHGWSGWGVELKPYPPSLPLPHTRGWPMTISDLVIANYWRMLLTRSVCRAMRRGAPRGWEYGWCRGDWVSVVGGGIRVWVSTAGDFFIFCGDFRLQYTRNLASSTRRVVCVCIIFITVASSPIASTNTFASDARRRENVHVSPALQIIVG